MVVIVRGIIPSMVGNKEVKTYIEAGDIDKIADGMREASETDKITLQNRVTIEYKEKNPVTEICSLCNEETNNDIYEVKSAKDAKFCVHSKCLTELAKKLEEGVDENKDMVVAGLL
jgi:hypothetical protein